MIFEQTLVVGICGEDADKARLTDWRLRLEFFVDQTNYPVVVNTSVSRSGKHWFHGSEVWDLLSKDQTDRMDAEMLRQWSEKYGAWRARSLQAEAEHAEKSEEVPV